jgi:hypothetical protein
MLKMRNSGVPVTVLLVIVTGDDAVPLIVIFEFINSSPLVKVIVPKPFRKIIVSSPGFALASIIA